MTHSHKLDPVEKLARTRASEHELPSTVTFGDTTVSLADTAEPGHAVPRFRLHVTGDLPFSQSELMHLAGTVNMALVINQDRDGLYVTSMNRRCTVYDLCVMAKRLLEKLQDAGQRTVSDRSGRTHTKPVQPRQDPQEFLAHMRARRQGLERRRRGHVPDAS